MLILRANELCTSLGLVPTEGRQGCPVLQDEDKAQTRVTEGLACVYPPVGFTFAAALCQQVTRHPSTFFRRRTPPTAAPLPG